MAIYHVLTIREACCCNLRIKSSRSSKLVQWNQTHDCCNWNGVDCDGADHVISLQLDWESITGGIGDSSSLFRFKYLEKLNLAYNEVNYSTPIPKGIHRLNNLTHLNLSYAGFGGQVPAEIASLRRLVSLDISSCNDNIALRLEYLNLEMLVQNLTGLRELYLDGVIITSSHERRKWSQIVSSYLPHLTTFSCIDCFLSGSFARSFSQLHSLSTLRLDDNYLLTVPAFFANFSMLTTLSLAHCSLMGSFPNMIFHIPTLQNLDLSANDLLTGSLPPFTLNGSLQSVRLVGTNFSGSIPSSISNLKNLLALDLRDCKFTGVIPSTFANLTQLTNVGLSYNLFTGSLSPTLFQGFSNLTTLYLSGNNLRVWVRNDNLTLHGFPQLRDLELASCNLSDFPDFIKHSGMIEELDLSNNGIGGEIPSWIWGLTQLHRLDLSNNGIGGEIPTWIRGLAQLHILDLSNNGISGEIPSWIWGLTELRGLNLSHNLLTRVQKPYKTPSSLFWLDLSSNQLRGELNLLIPPNITSHLWYLILSNNSFSGPIPTSLCTATKLETLDLSSNKLSGSIPSCLFDLTNNSLSAVDLGRNNISGRIPDNFPLLSSLYYLDLNNNTLEGEIPRSLKNCHYLEFMNVGNNIIRDTFPCMLQSSLRVLVLHSNRFHGEVTSCDHNEWPNLQILDISSNHFTGSLETINFSSWEAMVQGSDYDFRYDFIYDGVRGYGVTLIMKGLQVELYKIWSNFSTIDFSSNSFEGDIPNVIGELSSLHLLNLSHNALNGSIPKSFGKLRNLELLDLSRNQLTGAIPRELAEVSFLSVLNLSYNKLVGEIPNDPHFQTFSADSFEGNPELCGFNLNISCTTHTVDLSHENEGGEKEEIEWEFVSAALGYVVGLGSIVWLLLFCRSFRKKYFDKIEEVVEEMFDARDMRRRRRATARRRAVRNQAVMRRRQ